MVRIFSGDMDNMSAIERVWGTLDATCFVIKAPQVVLHKIHQPDLLRDFLDAEVLAGKYDAQIGLASPDADALPIWTLKPRGRSHGSAVA
jgi:hypothetical protein